jgi:hypothetical protein
MDNDAAILQMMSDVRQDLRTGFTNLSTKLDSHVAATNEKFQAVDQKFEAIHVQTAEAKGAADQKAKLYGFGGAFASTVFAGCYELLKYLWPLKHVAVK